MKGGLLKSAMLVCPAMGLAALLVASAEAMEAAGCGVVKVSEAREVSQDLTFGPDMHVRFEGGGQLAVAAERAKGQ